MRQNLADGSQTPVLKVNSGTIQDACLSSDYQWLAYQIKKPSGGYAIYVARVGSRPVSEHDIILIAYESSYQKSPRWSKDDSII